MGMPLHKTITIEIEFGTELNTDSAPVGLYESMLSEVCTPNQT